MSYFTLFNVPYFCYSSAKRSKVRFSKSIDSIVEHESVTATKLSEPFMYQISEVVVIYNPVSAYLWVYISKYLRVRRK